MIVFVRVSVAAGRGLPAGMASLEARQLWVGNIPQRLSEDDVLEEMSLYGVRPTKLILRHRELQGQDATA